MKFIKNIATASLVFFIQLNGAQPSEETRLFFDSIKKGDAKKVRDLLESGKIKVNTSMRVGWPKYQVSRVITPLGASLLSQNFNKELFSVLLGQPEIDVNAVSALPMPDAKKVEYFSPLMIAVQKNNLEAVRLLLEHDAQVNSAASSGKRTALHFAVQLKENAVPMITILLKYGAHIDAKDEAGKTPLFFADSPDVIKLLLSSRANVNARNIYNATPLIEAAVAKDKNKAKLLLEYGADPLLKDSTGKNAFTAPGGEEFMRELYETLKKEKMEIHRAARTPVPLTEQERKDLESLSPEAQSGLIKIPTQARGVPELIADYLIELTLQEKIEMRAQEESAHRGSKEIQKSE